MAGILDFLNQNPEQGRSLLAAAAQMLQQSGPSRTPQGLGQIIGGGVGAYYESQDQQRSRGQQEQLRGLQIKGAESDLLSQQRALEKAQALSAAAKSAYRTPGAQAAMPGAEGMVQQPGAEGGFDTDAYINQVMAIDPAMGFQLQQSMKKAAPKYDSGIAFVNGPDGKPMAVRTADDGSVKQLDGFAPREKLEFRDTGNAVLGVNPYTGERQASLAKGASPDALVSAATQRENSMRQDARAREANDISRQRVASLNIEGKPMSALQETKYRTQIAKDYQSANTILANMADVERSAAEVKKAPGLKGATGLQSYLPSMPNSLAAQAEVKLQNLEGKVTQLGKAAAAQGGAVGPMAVQEWKIVRDMIAAIDPSKGDQALLEQIGLVEDQSKGAAARLRDAYGKQYSADFNRYPQFEELAAPPPPAGNNTPKPAAASKFSVTAPDGKTYTFPDAKALANFKMTTGLK